MDSETPEFYKEKDILGLDKPDFQTWSDSSQKRAVPNDLPVEYASLGSRIAAYILDSLILIVPTYLIDYVVLAVFENSEGVLLIQSVINFAIYAIYYGSLESSEMQATFGKKICDIKVVDEFGNRLSFNKAALRYVAIIISIIPLGFGIWAIATDEKKQAWHDALLGCFVVKNQEEVLDNKN